MKNLTAFYRMLIIFFVLALGSKFVGFLNTWQEVPLWVMILVFLFTGISHFTPLRHEFVKMIPPAIPGKMFWVYFTGVAEIIGAVGLVEVMVRPYAAVGLIFLLLIMFPANFYAAKKNIHFRGAKPEPIWRRSLLQILFIACLYVGGLL